MPYIQHLTLSLWTNWLSRYVALYISFWRLIHSRITPTSLKCMYRNKLKKEMITNKIYVSILFLWRKHEQKFWSTAACLYTFVYYCYCLSFKIWKGDNYCVFHKELAFKWEMFCIPESEQLNWMLVLWVRYFRSVYTPLYIGYDCLLWWQKRCCVKQKTLV